jgi:hypothetical protein
MHQACNQQHQKPENRGPGFLGFAIEPNARYDIRDDDENCKLVVIGNPGTTFTMIEHKSATDLSRCHRNSSIGCVKLLAS